MQDENLFLEKFGKQIKLKGFGVPGQEALIKARVLVIGAGALGIPVITYLAAMGVGHLGIVEPGLVSLPELAGQPLYKPKEVGKAKLASVVQHVRDVNPDAALQLYDYPLHADNVLEVISGFDVIVDATNNLRTAILINDACVITGVPLVFGLVYQYNGLFSVFNYRKSATLRCLQSDAKLRHYLNEDEAEGVLSVLPGMIGCLLAAEVVKIVSGIGEVSANKLLVYDILKNDQRVLKVSLNPDHLDINFLRRPTSLPAESPSNKKVQSITPHQLSLKLSYQESLQLIDIREPEEWAVNQIQNAVHLPAATLIDHLNKIHQDIPVILISHRGEISKELTDLLLNKHGFGNIYYLEGGMEAWTREINSTESK